MTLSSSLNNSAENSSAEVANEKNQLNDAQEAKLVARYGPIYFAGNLLHRAAGIVLIPLYAHHLLPADYGVYALLLSVMDMLTILLGIGIGGAMNRFYFEAKTEQDRQRLISSVFICLLLLAAGIALIAYPLAWAIVQVMFASAKYALLFALAIVTLIFTLLFEAQMNYAVVRKRAWLFLNLALIKALLLIGFNLWWVAVAKWALWGVVGSMLITFALITLSYLGVIFKQVGWHWSPNLVKQLLRYGLPLVPSALANAAMTFVERYCLNHWVGVAAVGIYALAHRLASLLQMFIATPFAQIFFVRRFETLAQGEQQAALDRLLLVFVAVMSLAVLGLALFSEPLMTLIAPQSYAGVAPLVPWLGLCFVLSSINQNYELGILYQKKTAYIAWIGGLSLVATVVLNTALVPAWAIWGAVGALLSVNIIRLGATLWANRLCGATLIRLDLLRACGMLLLVLIASLLAHQLSGSWWVILLVKMLIWLAVMLLLFLSPIMDAAIRQSIYVWLKKQSIKNR